MTEDCSPPGTSEASMSGLMTEDCSLPLTSEASISGLKIAHYNHSSPAGILLPSQKHKKGRLFRGIYIIIYIFLHMYICTYVYIYIYIYLINNLFIYLCMYACIYLFVYLFIIHVCYITLCYYMLYAFY